MRCGLCKGDVAASMDWAATAKVRLKPHPVHEKEVYEMSVCPECYAKIAQTIDRLYFRPSGGCRSAIRTWFRWGKPWSCPALLAEAQQQSRS